MIIQMLTRRNFLRATLAVPAALAAATSRKWGLGINTYCLRFWRMNDRQLFDWVTQHKLDAIFLQDSLDPGVMDPAHWADVRRWATDAKLRIETGGAALLPPNRDGISKSVETLKRNIARAKAMGSPMVRVLMASDR